MGKRSAAAVLALFFIICSAAEMVAEQSDARFAYPDMFSAHPFERSRDSYAESDLELLNTFLDEWGMADQRGESLTLSAAAKGLAGLLAAQNVRLQQLESTYRVQSAELAYLERQRLPIFSLETDADENPLYAFSSTQSGTSHRFGIGASITQKLPTAGSLRLSLLQSSLVLKSVDDPSWSWSQAPSISFTFNQPLFVGEGVINTSYGNNAVEKWELEREGTLTAIDAARDQLVLQGAGLLSLRQSLLEHRWILTEYARLAEEEIEQAKQGSGEAAQVHSREVAFNQLLVQIAGVDSELESVRISIEELWGSDAEALSSVSVLPERERLLDLFRFAGDGLVRDEDLFVKTLDLDDTYLAAQREFQLAEIERKMGNPEDAPVLGLSFSVSPEYDADGFWESFSGLLERGEPSIRFSVSCTIPDLSRSKSRLTEQLLSERLVQAGLEAAEAANAVVTRIKELQQRLNKELLNLHIALMDYQQIGSGPADDAAGQSAAVTDSDRARREELSRYSAAFSVLQVLREIELLTLEIDLMTGSESF